MKEAARRRQELRRSNAAAPHRNRHREHKTGRDRVAAITEAQQQLIDAEEEIEVWTT